MNFVVVYNSVIFSLSKYFVPKDYSNYFTGEKTEANTSGKKTEETKSGQKTDATTVNGKKGAATYRTKFDTEWTKEFPEISKGSTSYHYWCTICRIERSCSHQGKADIKRHIAGPGHQQKLKDVKTSGSLSSFAKPVSKICGMTALETKVRTN